MPYYDKSFDLPNAKCKSHNDNAYSVNITKKDNWFVLVTSDIKLDLGVVPPLRVSRQLINKIHKKGGNPCGQSKLWFEGFWALLFAKMTSLLLCLEFSYIWLIYSFSKVIWR